MASSPIPPMLIELQLETAAIKAQMAQLNNNFESFGKTVEKQGGFLDKFKATAAGVFAGNLMVTGLNAVKSAISGAIQDAQQYEQLLAKTGAIIKSTGGIAGISAEEIKKQASALESVAAVDENVILQGENVIATFTNIRNVAGQGNDIFNQTAQAALDLSVVMGQDMQSSAVQLGKALSDPIKGVSALQRVGVTFDAQQKAQIKTMVESGNVMGAQKIILAEVNREFGGAAKAAGDTFAGAVFRAKDKVQDFGRNLVTELQPILLSIGKTIGDLYNKFLAPLFSWISKNKEAVALFVGIIGTAIVAFKAYQVVMAMVTAAQELYIVATALMRGAKLADIAATEGQTGAMVLLNAVMNANPIAVVVVALAALAAGFVYAWNHSETFRKVVINAFQAVLSGVSFAIRALAKFVDFASTYLILPFKTLLGALSHLPGVGKYAKEALNFIDDLPGNINKAADAVDSFSAGLDKLQNKKITIPGLGGNSKTATTPTVPTATAPGGGLTADQLKQLQKDAKAKQDAIKKANEEVQKIYQEQNKVLADYQDKASQLSKKKQEADLADQQRFDDAKASIDKKYEEASLKALADYQDRDAKLKADALAKETDLRAKAVADQASIVQRSRDLLRSAFETGTKFDLAKLFTDSDKSGAGLLAQLKAKLESAKTLQKKAGELASAGFSQTFIQEVVSQGPEMGASMADAILTATPDTVQQLKALYGDLTTVSQHGLDDLANQMSTSTKLATDDLTQAYAQISVDLNLTLAKNSQELTTALQASKKDYDDAITSAKKDQADAMVEITKTLQAALAQNQKDYNDAIDQLQKDTMAKLADLQTKLRETAAVLSQLQGAQAGIQALANAPAAPYLAQTTPLSPYSGASGAQTTYNYNIPQTFVSTSVDSAAVQNSALSAIKTGAAITVTSVNTSQGVTNKLKAMSARLLDL